jgi:hypothetical protein
LVLTALLVSSAPGIAAEPANDVNAAAELLKQLDSVAPVPSRAPSEPAPAAPQARPRGLSITTLQPRTQQRGIISQSSSTSTQNLAAPVPLPAAPSDTAPQQGRQAYTLQPAPPANATPGNSPNALSQPVGNEPAQPQLPADNGSPALDEATTETTMPLFNPAPPRRTADPSRTFTVKLGTSAPQRLEGNLGVNIIQADVHGRQLFAVAAVVNQGRNPLTRVELTFWVEGGGRQRVRIPELRPGQTRSIKVRVRVPRGNRPETIQVTSEGRRAAFATADNQPSPR